jgi:colanic acid biosynthesis glycosyl transferase WcaI
VGLRQHYDVAIFSNPALSTGLPFAVVAALRRIPAVFSIHDVYPDVGITLGIFRHRSVIALVAALERFCLREATRIRILSESFAPRLRVLGVPDSKMVLIYDWVDTHLIQPISRDNAFAREHQLLDKFVVLYAGNVGFSQGLESVLFAARKLAELPDIEFVVVGDGASRERLVAQAQKLGLVNVQFLPFQPRTRLPEVLATADVSLVMLQRGIGAQSLPSKSFSILASGRPLVSSVDENSDLSRLITRSQAGVCIPAEDPDRLVEAILTLRDDPCLRERLGQNGRAYAVKYHSPEAAAEQFEVLLATVAGAGK